MYNEYRWKGRNYKGQHAPEIVGLVRAWLRETYRDTSSLSDGRITPIHIRLMKADFEAFTKESEKFKACQPPSYPFRQILDGQGKGCNDEYLDFIMSYNFDDSAPMTDYFHTNFYLTLGIGSYKQPYKVEPPKLGKDKPEVFKHPEGPAHKAMRRHWAKRVSASSKAGSMPGK